MALRAYAGLQKFGPGSALSFNLKHEIPMAAINWKHGKTQDEARAIIQAELDELGYAGKVSWKGNELVASVGFGTVLDLKGRVTEDAIVLDKCGGLAGGAVLAQCTEILARRFPAAETS